MLSRDRGARRRRAAGDAVGRGDRHDDQPRGPGDPARSRRSRRPTGVRSDLDVIAGLAARLGSPVGVRDRPGGGLRRARPGLGRRRGRLRRHHLRPDPRRARRLLAVPDAGRTRARRGCSPTPSPTADGRARFVAVEHRGPAEAAGRGLPAAPHHRPGARAVPVRRADPPGRASCPTTGPVRRAAPDAGRADRRARRRAGRASPPAAASSSAPARVVDHDPAGHGLRAVPLGRRQPAHQRRARPGQPDAGVQGVRGGGDAHDAETRSSSSAPAWPRPGWSRSWPRRSYGGDGHRARRRAAPAVQPDPAVGGARGHPQLDALTLRSAAWFAERGVDLRLGTRVARDRPRRPREVELVDGSRVAYDRLVLATGSIPTLPPIRGLVRLDGRLHPKVHAFRSPRRLPAARRRGPRPARSAVVVGGGLLGLQVARALAIRGLATEIVEGGEHLLAQPGRRARPARSWPATCGGSAPPSTPAPAPITADRRRACVLDNGYTLDDRPGRAHRRRPPVDGAGPPGRARRYAAASSSTTTCASVDRRPHPRDRRLRPARRPGHRLRAAGLGAGRACSPAPRRRGRVATTAPAASPGCAPPTSTSPCSATPSAPTARSSR